MKDWDEAVAFALALPGTELSTSYGKPAVKVNGRAFLYTGREQGSFGVAIDLDSVDMLKETDPDTFWQSAHYQGWPAILVRYASEDPERVGRVIERSHALDGRQAQTQASKREVRLRPRGLARLIPGTAFDPALFVRDVLSALR